MELIEETLKQKPAKVVALVHGETSTGVMQGELAAIAKRYHWRLKDLRRDLENFTAVQISADA